LFTPRSQIWGPAASTAVALLTTPRPGMTSCTPRSARGGSISTLLRTATLNAAGSSNANVTPRSSPTRSQQLGIPSPILAPELNLDVEFASTTQGTILGRAPTPSVSSNKKARPPSLSITPTPEQP
jgi:hypothetical protein